MINIVEKLDKETAKRIKQFPHPNNRASEAGHSCVRFLVLSRLHPEKKVLHDVGLQRIFDEGRLHEGAMLREVEDAGFAVVEQQRPFEWQKLQLAGHIDAKISMNGRLVPLEIKSSSPNAFRHIKDLEPMDMLKSKLSGTVITVGKTYRFLKATVPAVFTHLNFGGFPFLHIFVDCFELL